MNSVPIFDSLTHPMPTGQWLNNKPVLPNTIEQLLKDMRENNIRWAMAVGMGSGIGGYAEDNYAQFIRDNSDNLFPVAFVDFSKLRSATDVPIYVRKLRALGYAGIKIHPRRAAITYSHPLIPALVECGNDAGLAVLICTYVWGPGRGTGARGIDGLIEMLNTLGDGSVVLLHGGAVRLLELAEYVRHRPNLLLDISFTLCKYVGSSLDQDIGYLFRHFDRRICVGSDSPSK